ncbi:MAG TPA: CBS domain-containing protein [Bradyrhizobium sp.]|nr:CBS domain-containing protein [Bradyrhizobium sp.]
MLAHQIMSRHVVTVGVDASVADAIAIMLGHHVSGLPVVDAAGRLVGIVSEGDFLHRAEIDTERKRGRWLSFFAGTDRLALDFARSHGRRVGEVMTRNPLTIGEDTPLADIVDIMETHKVKRLPVMRGDSLVGMVTRTDFLPAVARLARRTVSKGAAPDDDRIRELVIAAMADAPWRPCAMNVDVQDGIVSLRGSVRSDKARQAAIVAAENVPGVSKVKDDLTIYPAPEDEYGGGDFASLPEETSTVDDQPL